MEILAPLGKLKYLEKIISSGADAVYAGVKGFSSRPEFSDLTIEEIGELVKIAHSKGCRVYVALNACIPERRVAQLIEIAERLDQMEVDALILAEFGIISILAERLNHSEIHASTLLGVYNSKTIELLKKYHVKRVVLSSDLFVDEIGELIRRSGDMEYEIIAAGGICFQCNRQCRLIHGMDKGNYHVACQNEYELLKNGVPIGAAHRIGAPSARLYLSLGMYYAMGINSFKIEGRTNNLEDVCHRIIELDKARKFVEEHENHIPGCLHYISRYLEGIKC